jgi:hypothetical protein
MTVQSVGHSKGVYFLNSEPNYRSAENFTLFINRLSAARFSQAGIADPAGHFDGKSVRATGTVRLFRGRPELIIEDPAQITIVGSK